VQRRSACPRALRRASASSEERGETSRAPAFVLEHPSPSRRSGDVFSQPCCPRITRGGPRTASEAPVCSPRDILRGYCENIAAGAAAPGATCKSHQGARPASPGRPAARAPLRRCCPDIAFYGHPRTRLPVILKCRGGSRVPAAPGSKQGLTISRAMGCR